MNNVTPKPLPDVNLPKLNQVGKPASSLREYGRESPLTSRILVFGELPKGGEA